MKKIAFLLAICLLLSAILVTVRDRNTLQSNILRLHVVANSDSDSDQAIKLQVRDAVLAVIQSDMENIENLNDAKKYICEKLPELEQTANEVLIAAGSADRATVTLASEEFPTRYYDTFTLPAGVYESLRIRIGKAEGRNWWCVVFPNLCLGAVTAEESGFSQDLTETLTGEGGYELRFFLLDLWGRLENFFHKD